MEVRWLERLAVAVAVMGAVALGLYLGLSAQAERRELEERVGPLTIGETETALLLRAGEPDAECQGTGWKPKELHAGLETASYWIYRLNSRYAGADPCVIQYQDTIIGFSEAGRIQWFKRVWGESALQMDE